MIKKELNITISGETASGKSRLTYLLKKFLREEGFDVRFGGNIDHPTENDFDLNVCNNFDNAIDYIKQTSEITINEVQIKSEKYHR